MEDFRQGLEPITVQEPPGLLDELQRLSDEARLPRTPVFLWNPLGADLPVAFGTWRRQYVTLSGGFVVSFLDRNRSAFRAIILHELAHIYNGDVGKTHFTIAIWIAVFGISGIFACVVLNFDGLNRVQFFIDAILMNVIIILSGLAVLRSREYYADVKASVWDKTTVGVGQALRTLPASSGKGWRGFLDFHPPAAERRRILADPGQLLNPRLLDAFGIGMAAQLTITSAGAIGMPFAAKSSWLFVAYTAAALSLIPIIIFSFAIGALGIRVWLGAFSALMRGESPYRRTAHLAVALMLGYLFAIIFSTLTDPATYSQSASAVVLSVEGFQLGIGLLLLLAAILTFRWIAANVSAWLEVVLRRRSPRGLVVMIVGAAVFLVGGSFIAATLIILTLSVAPMQGLYFYVQLFGIYMALAATIAWGFPLSASLWGARSSPRSIPEWVFLDGSTGEIPDQERLRPSRAVFVGVIVGLIFCLLCEVVYFRKYLPFGSGDWVFAAYRWSERSTVGALGLCERGTITTLFAVVAQALAGAAGAQVTRLRIACGLFGSFIAWIVIATWNWVFFGYDWLDALFLLEAGTLAALPVVFAASFLRGLVRRGLRPTRPGWLRVAITSTAVLGVVVSIGTATRLFQEMEANRVSAAMGDAGELGMIYTPHKYALPEKALAVGKVHRAAERGIADAENSLAQMYLLGRGVPRDLGAALFWLSKAAEQGQADAENILGKCTFRVSGCRRMMAKRCAGTRRQQRKVTPTARIHLGVLYHLGRGVQQDDTIAVEWFRKSAEKGYAEAENNLGLLYAKGTGTTQDDAQAMQWFRRAANQGHADAQYNLGEMYELGRSVPQDDEIAVAWLHSAAGQGHALARQHLEIMCGKGIKWACPRAARCQQS